MTTEEQTLLVRTFEAEVSSGDGRTIEARIVPYNTPGTATDPPDFTPYQEMFLPGAFERQTRAANRVQVWLNFEHEQGIGGIIGHGLELQDEPDALYGKFRIHQNRDGDKALSLVNEGVLTGMSVEFVDLGSRTVNGIMARTRAHLDKVALCMPGKAAYKQAEVLAVRTQAIHVEPPAAMSEELLERLARIGVEPLKRITISRKQWDGNASRFTDEQYQASCLIDRGGDTSVKERCSLPVLEPDGALNVNALPAAAAALAGARTAMTGVTATMKQAAARKLLRYYRLAQLTPPDSIVTLARS